MPKEKSSGKTSVNDRKRNFATVVYPDSENTPSDWMDILAEQKVAIMVSPLHNNDVNPSGEKKKPHYHVLLCFEGLKSNDQAKSIFDLVGGVGLEIVQSIRGYARYLCHLDNPEKAQYDQGEVKCFGGADFATAISLAYDKYKALVEMEEFCEKYNVLSFFALARYASVNRTDWSRVLKDNGAIYMKEYLQSRKWSIEQGLDKIVNPETGEIM